MAAFIWPSFTSLDTTAEAKRLKLTTMHVLSSAHWAALASGGRVKVCLSDDGVHCALMGHGSWLSLPEASRVVTPLNAKRVRLHWRAMAENQGGILFTPQMAANASVWACVPGQHQPVWVLSVNRFGVVHEGRAALACTAV